MRWQRLSDWCLQSDCRRYTVAKFAQGDGWVYAAYRGATWLGRGTTAAECKAMCVEDSK